MGDATVKASHWRLVERGRVVLFTTGEYEGRLAAITEIVDHKRVLVDGPSTDPAKLVKRHSVPLSHLALTHIVIPKTPLAIGTGGLRKLWEAAGVEKNWDDSAHAQGRSKSDRRRQLTDFERFKVMRLRKQARFETRKAVAKIRTAA